MEFFHIMGREFILIGIESFLLVELPLLSIRIL